MNELNFQTGRKTYVVNGCAEISFDPADINFSSRLYDLMKKFEDEQKTEKPEVSVDVFKTAAERDTEVRAAIDEAFGEPVCDKVFGSANVCSPAGGLPLYMNFLMAVFDEIDGAAAAETKISPRVEAYMKKYESKYGKYMKT